MKNISMVFALFLGLATTAYADRPNILLILMDDLGYADLGVHGATDVRTPHIDRLAHDGLQFTQSYASGNVCTPTRAALMTGQYQQRVRVEHIAGILPRSVPTLPQRLRQAGYHTGMTGKWHLSDARGYRPVDRGFDEYYGFLTNGYRWHNLPGPGKQPVRQTPTSSQSETLREFLPIATGREASRFIRANAHRPWFYYLAFHAVHTPLEASPEYLRRFSSIENPKRRQYAATLSAADDAIGMAIEALQETGQLDNTLVIFTNDNGGPLNRGESANTSRNTPFAGRKGTSLEGGIRVPLFMHWPARFGTAGRLYHHPVITMDVSHTVTAVADAQALPGNDGVNLLPYVAAQDRVPHQTLYWRNTRLRNTHAVRHDDWKLVYIPGSNQYQLFDLSRDIGEQRNLAGTHPAVVTELRALWNRWNRSVNASSIKTWRAEQDFLAQK